MTTSSPRDTAESLHEVASEIIRLYHSPAPIRENLDLIRRHGLAMAQALVDIDKVTASPGRFVTRAEALNIIARVRSKLHWPFGTAILDGSVAAQETTCIDCGEALPPGSAERGVERCLRCKAIRKPVPGPPSPPRNLNHPRPVA